MATCYRVPGSTGAASTRSGVMAPKPLVAAASNIHPQRGSQFMPARSPPSSFPGSAWIGECRPRTAGPQFPAQ